MKALLIGAVFSIVPTLAIAQNTAPPELPLSGAFENERMQIDRTVTSSISPVSRMPQESDEYSARRGFGDHPSRYPVRREF
ncbi:hypothetical protein [Pararhizobium haloflavum]|uniref:hypothetical protein n=1 Tax=Pararhizobium haloflavum TaxID=2037914 RepID=UPI000C18BB56|nr:hypothetical protein [Pararhizobium haloflavum]